MNIVKRALEEPTRQIAQNAGHEGAVVVGRVRDSKDENFGFNAESGEYTDLVKAGVIDPAKVTRLALQNAASIAALMLTTEVLVADIKEEEIRLLAQVMAAWAECTKKIQILWNVCSLPLHSKLGVASTSVEIASELKKLIGR